MVGAGGASGGSAALTSVSPRDHAVPSRSPALAETLLRTLPDRPRLLLAEAPDESVLCWLGMLIGRAQRWLIADATPAHIDALFERVAQWAHRCGLTATWPSRALLIHAPGGAWRIEGFPVDATELMTGDFADAVIADQPEENAAIWRAYRTPAARPPLLATLCATGHVQWMPRHPADTLLRTPPPRPPDQIIATLRASGCAVSSAVSDWRVPPASLAVLRALVTEAAGIDRPGRTMAIDAWRAVRLRQSLAGRLAVRIGYRDILAIPQPDEPA